MCRHIVVHDLPMVRATAAPKYTRTRGRIDHPAVGGPRIQTRPNASMAVHAKEHGTVCRLAEVLAFEFAPSADCAVTVQCTPAPVRRPPAVTHHLRLEPAVLAWNRLGGGEVRRRNARDAAMETAARKPPFHGWPYRDAAGQESLRRARATPIRPTPRRRSVPGSGTS